MSLRTGGAEHRCIIPLLLGAAGAIMLLSACKATTWYSLEVDVLSYIPEGEHRKSWVTDDAVPDRTIFLPYLDSPVNDGIALEGGYSEGIVLELPVPDDPGTQDLTLMFEIDADVLKGTTGGSFERARFRLFLAPIEAKNVYDDNHMVLSLDVEDIPDGGSTNVTGTRTIRRGDPGFEILRTGRFRLGADGHFVSDADVDLGYELNTMQVKISLRPFSFLP